MIEIPEEVYNQLKEENQLFSETQFPEITETTKCILNLISNMAEEDWVVVVCGNNVGYSDISVVHSVIEELTEDETPLEILDDIVTAFVRGHNENGWMWRSLTSLARETGLDEDVISQFLSENDELFEVSSNGRVWRYTDL